MLLSAVWTPNRARLLVALILVTGGCAAVEEDTPLVAPDPIGDELLRYVGTWSVCSGGAHLYREGHQIQSQCFDGHGDFLYENRGALTPDAAAELDAQIAAADPSKTAPVNYLGFCGAPDSNGTVTLWVEDEPISFESACLIEGIVALYEHLEAISTELSDCGDGFPVLLESIEPGCRWR